MTLELVAAGTRAPVRLTVTMDAVHLCPFKDETDEGSATVTWEVTAGNTLELHSLRAHLDSLDEWVVSHERFTATLVNELRELGLGAVTVTTTWQTAGGTVTVTA